MVSQRRAAGKVFRRLIVVSNDEEERSGQEIKRADLAIRPPFPWSSFSLAFALRNYFVQLEDWQEHRNDDAAYDYPEEHNQQRLDQ